MTVSPPATDHHRAGCAALERSTPLLVEAVRRAPAAVRPSKMRWTNAEIAAHMYASAVEAEKAVRGKPSAYDEEPTAELDEQMVEQVHERDTSVLATMVEQATTAFLHTVRDLPADAPVATPRATAGTFVGLLALDHHLHGGQFTETVGSTWNGRVADLHGPLSVVLPYAFDPDAAKGFRASFTLTLTGAEPVRYAIEDGALRLDVPGRTDCTITADPQTFVRLGIGVVSQLRAGLTGKMRAGGRKPWLAFTTSRLFPPIPHGGVAR